MALRALARARNTSGLQLRTSTHASQVFPCHRLVHPICFPMIGQAMSLATSKFYGSYFVVLQDTRQALACGFASDASADAGRAINLVAGNHLELKLENPVLSFNGNNANVMEDAEQSQRSKDTGFEAYMKGQSIRWLYHNVMTAGQGSAMRPEAARASLSRQLHVAYRAECLASSCRGPSSALRFHAAAFSTQRGKQENTRREIAAQDEDPFDPLTDRIPEKPVTFAEGASYSVAIFAGFAVAAAAAYAVFKELIFEPKEYKVFNKALDRVQNDNQVTVRIGLPVTGYGQDSRNRAARQRIPHRTWADEDGVERIEVQFYVRGPHGVGRVHSEMFKDKEDKQWKFTYLIVDILSPSPTRLMLESYVPT